MKFLVDIDQLVSSVKKYNVTSDDRVKLNTGVKNNIKEKTQVQKLTNTEEIEDFYEYTEECLRRIIKLKVPPLAEIKDLLFDLPFEAELATKKLAIFDLDETLIHCEAKKPQKAQKQIMCNLPSGGQAKVTLKNHT